MRLAIMAVVSLACALACGVSCRAAAASPADLAELRERAAVLMDADRDKEALPVLDAILDAAPDDGATYNDRGLVRWRMIRGPHVGDGFAALQARLCLEVDADCPDLRLAVADFGRAIALMPGEQRAIPYANRAEIAFARGDPQGALADEDQSLTLRPGSARTHERRAEMRLALGDRSGALADLDAALALDNDTTTRARRAEIRKEAGDRDGARADADAALSRPPPPGENPRIWQHRLHSLRRAVARSGEPGMEQELSLSVVRAELQPGARGLSKIEVTLDPDSAARFGPFTQAHIGSRTDVSLDGRSLMRPTILTPIMGDKLQITGTFESGAEEALVARLKSGARILVRALD